MSYFDLLKLAAPEAIMVATALVVLAVGIAIERRAPSANPIRWCVLVAAVGLIATGIVLQLLPDKAALFGGMLVINGLTKLFKTVCLVLALFTIVLARGDAPARHRGEYIALILLATVGLILLIGSEEFLVVFIGLELLGLTLYVLTAFDRNAQSSAEAGLKYFLFGSTASAFSLFGISLLYGGCGGTTFGVIAEKLSGSAPVLPLLYAGMVMTLIGFAFKIAAAPFHLWVADAYQGAPAPSAAFIASASKVASFVVLGKILLIAFGPAAGSAAWHKMAAGWTPILAALAALSILLGNLVALAQTNVRRLLAYSAVAHAGYTLLGLVTGARPGFAATLFYTSIYAITLIGAFGVVSAVRRQTGGDSIANFAGLHKRSPLLAACLAIFILSLAGLPPLAGFFGKFFLFSAALGGSADGGLLWLVIIALLGSLISLYYYLMVLKAAFLDPDSSGATDSSPWLEKATVTLLAGLVVALGVWPAFLVDRIAAVLG